MCRTGNRRGKSGPGRVEFLSPDASLASPLPDRPTPPLNSPECGSRLEKGCLLFVTQCARTGAVNNRELFLKIRMPTHIYAIIEDFIIPLGGLGRRPASSCSSNCQSFFPSPSSYWCLQCSKRPTSDQNGQSSFWKSAHSRGSTAQKPKQQPQPPPKTSQKIRKP